MGPSRPADPPPLAIRGRWFAWGERTYVMGILNATPDSFSGDGLLATDDPVELAVGRAVAMAAEGADLLDIGGESTRPGHRPVPAAEERARIEPVIRGVRAALPDIPISVDTTKRAVAEAALDAGADLLNDVAATDAGAELAPLAAERRVPLVLMHGRRAAPLVDVVREVRDDLARTILRAVRAGCEPELLLVDPGFGFGKSPAQNLELLRELGVLRALGHAVLLGTSRKSTIGRVLDLPADQRLAGTLATTALGIAAGADMVRVHDVAQNVQAARMADAVVRGWRDPDVAG